MQSILNWLTGKKTYIVAILAAIFNVGVTLGWWAADNQIVILINTILGSFGLAFLRAGVTKSGK